MADNLRTAFGLGGGGFSKKVQLVSDLRAEYEKLNAVLQESVKLSKQFSDNMAAASGRSSSLPGAAKAPAVQGDVNDLNGFIRQPAAPQATAGSTAASVAGTVIRGLLGATTVVAGAVNKALPTNEQWIENRTLQSRMQFFGASNPNQMTQSMMNRGIGTDPLDAARASMAGVSYGYAPALGQYNTITNNAVTMSNLVPGVGMERGMQATAALNQASSVNKLRMIGVNVRNAEGYMRPVKDIAGELWGTLNAQKTGSGKLTKKDLAFSLQPGYALDSILNQYFGNDPVLRQAVVTVLMDRAGGGSGELTKPALIKSEAISDIAASEAKRMAASTNVVNATTPIGVEGIISANKVITDFSDKFAASVGTFAKAIEGAGFLRTLAGAGNGAGGDAMAGAAGVAAGALTTGLPKLIGGLFNQGKTVLTGGVNTLKTGGWKGLLSGGLKGLLKGGLLGGAAFAGLEGIQQLLNNKWDLPDWANAAFDVTQGGVSGFAGAGPWGLLAGLLGGGYEASSEYGDYTTGKGGAGDASPTTVAIGANASASGGSVLPLSGALRVTSPWNQYRTGKYGRNKNHSGIDYAASTGTPVYAVREGTIQPTSMDSDGYGNYVQIQHTDGAQSLYAHLSEKVRSSGHVRAGDLIGKVGSTGNSTGPHLHFEVRKNGTHIDPTGYLTGSITPSAAADGTTPPGGVDAAVNPYVAQVSTTGISIFGTAASKSLFESRSGELVFSTDGPGGTGGAADTAPTGNYGTTIGEVNIQITVPKNAAIDERKLAREVKKIFDEETQMKSAVTR